MTTTQATNPASLISVSSTTRTDAHTTLPIEPVYAATACVALAIIVPCIVLAVRGFGEARKLREDQQKLAVRRTVNDATIRAGLVVRD